MRETELCLYDLCFSSDRPSIADLCRLRDDSTSKLRGPVDIHSLEWIWDRVARSGPLGEHAVRYGKPSFAACFCADGSGIGARSDRDLRATSSSAEANNDIGRIWEEFGVRVHVTYDARSYFPPYWKEAPFSGQGSQIDRDEGKRLVRLIPSFLFMYPPELIVKTLRDIYLLKSMSFYGLRYGGTCSPDGIYIASQGDDRACNDALLTAQMHSEFSSILYRTISFRKTSGAT